MKLGFLRTAAPDGRRELSARAPKAERPFPRRADWRCQRFKCSDLSCRQVPSEEDKEEEEEEERTRLGPSKQQAAALPANVSSLSHVIASEGDEDFLLLPSPLVCSSAR